MDSGAKSVPGDYFLQHTLSCQPSPGGASRAKRGEAVRGELNCKNDCKILVRIIVYTIGKSPGSYKSLQDIHSHTPGGLSGFPQRSRSTLHREF